jgi:[ribosomal protein S5]-alanine N-acetyltransferase
MPTRPSQAPLVGERVYLRAPRKGDADTFLAAARQSRRLHGAWVTAPLTRPAFEAYRTRFGSRASARRACVGYLARRRDDDSLVGVFNFSEIVRGAFQSAYLGYYGFRANAGQGLMKEALGLALDTAFGQLGLHRVEVNIQPRNTRSIGLVTTLGFAREGFSRRYLRIAGAWRDHVRFAMLIEDWRRLRRASMRRSAPRP